MDVVARGTAAARKLAPGTIRKSWRHNGFEVHIYTMKWGGGRSTVQGAVQWHALRPTGLNTKQRRSILQVRPFAGRVRLPSARYDVVEVDQIPIFRRWLSTGRAVRRKPVIATWHEVWEGSTGGPIRRLWVW